MLPNLIIIGAAKSGTTSLHRYLDLHPDIAMSRLKELKFFVRDDWSQALDWYGDQFEPARIRGESSPNYTMFPFLPSTAERIRTAVPDVKLIYVLRDPIDRAVASYVEHVHLGLEARPLTDALIDLHDPAHPYVCPSRYASQLQRFLDCFPREQILVLDHTDLLSSRHETLATVFRFLEVDPTFSSPHFDEVLNTRDDKVSYGRVGRWMIRHRVLTERREFFRHGPPLAPLRRLLSRPIDSTLADTDRRRLVDALTPDVDELRRLTGESWAAWPNFAT